MLRAQRHERRVNVRMRLKVVGIIVELSSDRGLMEVTNCPRQGRSARGGMVLRARLETEAPLHGVVRV